jgi:hypothetical protein
VDDNSDAASTNAIIVECLQVNTDINQQLEGLLNSRYDGAANIRGIRYQVAYSLLRAFGLYEGESNASIRQEGIEDVDVNGSRDVEARGLQIGGRLQNTLSDQVRDMGPFLIFNATDKIFRVGLS